MGAARIRNAFHLPISLSSGEIPVPSSLTRSTGMHMSDEFRCSVESVTVTKANAFTPERL